MTKPENRGPTGLVEAPWTGLTRRDVGLAAAGAGAFGLFKAVASHALPLIGADAHAPGLGERARRRGMSFGCAAAARQLAKPSALRDAIVREAGMLVPENELKWTATQGKAGQPDYRGIETMLRFAAEHRMPVRGHAAFWYRGVPGWVAERIKGSDGRRLALQHVRDICRHFRGRVPEWDVVNEPVEPKDGQPSGLRLAPFSHVADPTFYADCFAVAHQADPAARLYINEYGLEADNRDSEARRTALLRLLTELLRRRAPIHGLGTQTHIGYAMPFDARRYRDFLAEVAALGLAIRITEFDALDKNTVTDPVRADQQTADFALEFLRVAFDEPAVQGLITWGLSDSTTWLRKMEWAKHPAGRPVRPLPLDDQMRRKPLWEAIGQAFDGAAPRLTV